MRPRYFWALNIIGHKAYEKKAPAFADDPLSFIAGPFWDAKNALEASPRLAGIMARFKREPAAAAT